jgi:hypothetical protein
MTKAAYKKFDIVAEVRGSIIGYKKLKKIIEDRVVDQSRLPVLLYLNF